MFITFCAKHGHDLTHPEAAEAIIDAMGRVGQTQRVRVCAYCVMPDHVHVTACVREEGGDLAQWVRYAKREVARVLAAPGMWERSYWDAQAHEAGRLVSAVEYTLDNPTRKGLTSRWQEWPFAWSQWHQQMLGRDPNLRT
jgi:putative transposase